ncbi:uncharacterized protein C9orf153 homolog [Tupaia chinensis]|uniref:uncharacterized protein C9orf153 homolog n=1 Tax=Tupaia chinensis TaxID=246437 RepID=UPI0003C8F1D1|nr:uncharacterized protein C9orf153 homolog [Tupaia chinensis]XP_006139910.1 uncharacterized protein C9orf153 homolog [Tupaia chinensis]
MFFTGDVNLPKVSWDEALSKCSLPELYTSVENFNKRRKKLNLLKTHGILLNEAQKTLTKNLNAMNGTDMREEDPQPVFMCRVVKKEEKKKPESMADLLHHSLLTGSLSAVERLTRSQQRLAQYGIQAPAHTFPYSILTDHTDALPQADVHRKSLSTKILFKLGLCSPISKFTFEDKVPKYFLIDPEKQFLDLRDLEWRYFKGLAKWRRVPSISFMDIQYDSEKRFVESQDMPGVIFPPLVWKSLTIYPQIDYQKEGTYSLKWNT